MKDFPRIGATILRGRPRLTLALASALLATQTVLAAPSKAGKTPPLPAGLSLESLSTTHRARVEEAWEVLSQAKTEENFLEKKRLVEKQLSRLRGVQTKSALGPYLLGMGYKELQEYGKAETQFRKATEAAPELFDAWKHLAWMKLEVATTPSRQRFSGKGRMELLSTASEAIDKALEMNDQDTEAYLIRVRILLRRAQAEKDPNKKRLADETSKEWIESPHYQEAEHQIRTLLERLPPRSPAAKQFFQLQLHVEQALYGAPRAWRDSGDFFVRRKKNYRVVTDHSQKLANELAEQANFIARAYRSKIFSDIPKPKQVFNIFVYTTLKDYVRIGGGSPRSLGFYSPFTRILVVLYNENDPKQSILVLNHEAMHQFVHDDLKNAPMWFNEGLGDYFGPYERTGKATLASRPNTMRLNDTPKGSLGIKSLIRGNHTADIQELMLMTMAEFYSMKTVAPGTPAASRNYAQAWSLVYFMNETDSGRKYVKYLRKYYGYLRRGWHFHEAFKESFGKADLEKLERDWKFEIGLLN